MSPGSRTQKSPANRASFCLLSSLTGNPSVLFLSCLFSSIARKHKVILLSCLSGRTLTYQNPTTITSPLRSTRQRAASSSATSAATSISCSAVIVDRSTRASYCPGGRPRAAYESPEPGRHRTPSATVPADQVAVLGRVFWVGLIRPRPKTDLEPAGTTD